MSLLAGGGEPRHHLCVTDLCDRFQRIARQLLDPRVVDVDSVPLELVEV